MAEGPNLPDQDVSRIHVEHGPAQQPVQNHHAAVAHARCHQAFADTMHALKNTSLDTASCSAKSISLEDSATVAQT